MADNSTSFRRSKTDGLLKSQLSFDNQHLSMQATNSKLEIDDDLKKEMNYDIFRESGKPWEFIADELRNESISKMTKRYFLLFCKILISNS